MKKNEKLDIIYQDKEIIVVNKPHNLLCVGTEKEKERTLFHKVSLYEKKKNPRNKIFIIHRLDKDTSGVVVFAKSEKIKKEYQDNWDNLVVKREYIAMVEGKVEKESDTIESYLKENKILMSYSTKETDGKLAITKYKRLDYNKSFSLLEINILTGRKNQIRVHMSDIGHPIVGDKKYGSVKNSINRMGLHATALEIKNPKTKQIMVFKTPIPKEFLLGFKNS